MNVICYIINDETHWEETNLTTFQWEYANPDKTLKFAFDKDTNLIKQEGNILWNWSKYAEKYGFSHKDRNTVFHDSNIGHDLQLIQFLPQNRKYKCQVKDLENGKQYKMSPKYVKHLMAETAARQIP